MAKIYQKVSGEVTKLKDQLEPIEGLYLESVELTHSTGFVIQKDNETILLAGGTSLARSMKKIRQNTFVRITYQGEGVSENGNTFQKCLVEQAI